MGKRAIIITGKRVITITGRMDLLSMSMVTVSRGDVE